jgi:uncharacterized cupredoxin-like copper-binding protein
MADQPPDLETRSRPGIPRWVWVLALAGLVAVLLVVAVMLVSGGQHGPGLHAAASDSSTATPADRGPAIAGDVGGPAEADEADRIVEVSTLDAMTFEPGTIDVSAGETVTFKVTNTGQTAHEFTVGDAAMQKEHADAMTHMPGGMPHDLPNSIRLQPGETKALTWRFGEAGVLEYACHEPGHYDAGMRGQVNVG